MIKNPSDLYRNIFLREYLIQKKKINISTLFKYSPKKNCLIIDSFLIFSFYYLINCTLIAEKPLTDLSFSKDTLLPFFITCEQLLLWKKTFSFVLSSVIKP